MGAEKKITVLVPDDLLERAQRATGEGIAPTIRRGLELVAAADACRRLAKLRGKVHLSIDLDRLRDDRS